VGDDINREEKGAVMQTYYRGMLVEDSVVLAEGFKKEIEQYKKSTSFIRVGSINLAGFATVVHNLDDEAGCRAFWNDLEELIFPEGEESSCMQCDLAIKVRIYRMIRDDFDELDEFDGW